MSLLQREPVRIGRAERKGRDDRFFLVATEDTYAAKQYFDNISLAIPRVHVKVLPTPEGSGLSSPHHVVDRLRNAFAEAKARREVQDGDEFWVLIDRDHHTRDGHSGRTVVALDSARQFGFEVAVSNPSFELWLLLHHAGVGKVEAFPDAASVVARLQEVLGSYRKDAIQPERFGLERVPIAIERARVLEENPDDAKGYWPETAGTRVYRLMEALGFGKDTQTT